MLCRALPVRPATALTNRLQPHPTAAFSTAASKRPHTILTQRCTSKTTQSAPRIRIQLQQQKRTNSSSASPVDATASTTTATPDPDATLTWNRFLALRKTRRRISLVASILSALGCFSGGIIVLSTQDFDTMGAQMFGLDPFIVLGMGTFACGTVGWLMGPFFGNAIFNMYYRKLGPQIAMKEREFYARIKKFRVDPTSSSMQNPVPDYYGEKIGSVTDYRRWLKDQRAFNLKRGKMV